MKQPGGDPGRAEDDDGAGKEHRAQPLPPGEQPERGAAEPKRHVKKDRVGAHREAPALRRSAAHGFNAKAGIDERITEAGERGAAAAKTKFDANQIKAKPAASTNTQTSATLAPPSLSGV